MPELPDLVYIEKYLSKEIVAKTIGGVTVRQPVVLRVALRDSFEVVLVGKKFGGVEIHGPFLRFILSSEIDMILNLMLAGSIQHQRKNERAGGYLCCSLALDDGSFLNLCDNERMAKLYLVKSGDYSSVPRYTTQGIDIRAPAFTREVFRAIAARHSRKQVRVFINDHTIFSSIGNAYADEILFDARIHPKTFVGKLIPEELDRLHSSIQSVLEWGMKKVAEAQMPIQVKVREHMNVRNRHGEPCTRCGTTIRREGVRGHDVYFCPTCQPASRKLFIDWTKK